MMRVISLSRLAQRTTGHAKYVNFRAIRRMLNAPIEEMQMLELTYVKYGVDMGAVNTSSVD